MALEAFFQRLDFTGTSPPPALVLHCTLLINTALQWKFGLSGAHTSGKGPNMGRDAGPAKSETTSLLGA
jgi:hypothetical protein